MIPGGTETERRVNQLAARLGVQLMPHQARALAAMIDAQGQPIRLVATRKGPAWVTDTTAIGGNRGDSAIAG